MQRKQKRSELGFKERLKRIVDKLSGLTQKQKEGVNRFGECSENSLFLKANIISRNANLIPYFCPQHTIELSFKKAALLGTKESFPSFRDNKAMQLSKAFIFARSLKT